MPGKGRKTPITETRKRVTASARARISTKRIRKDNTVDSSGSYLQDPVSTNHPQTSTTPPKSSTDQILALLTRLDESNKALTARMDKMEQRPSLDSTPVIPRSHGLDHRPLDSYKESDRPTTLRTQAVTFQDTAINGDLNRRQQVPEHTIPTASNYHLTHSSGYTAVNQLPSQSDGSRRDAILPSVDVLRRLPTISDRVSSVLASYEQQNRHEAAQGKISAAKKSGRYNTVDIATVPPHLRWPNEGCHGVSGRKRQTYDELSLPQWVSGQLTNIYNIQDPTLVKQALLQVIMATRDATSLPWPAVRGAWAASMHEIEEGTLSWENTTQWSLNRLSASQLAMTNITSAPQGRKQCKYFNEGTCSHESSHGNYLHTCSYCSKQGRQSGHPEIKCSFKTRNSAKPNAVSH